MRKQSGPIVCARAAYRLAGALQRCRSSTTIGTHGDNLMFDNNSRAVAAFVVATTLISPSLAHAGESGKFQGHAVLEVTKFTEYKTLEGHPMKSGMLGEMDGLIFHNGGGSNLDRLLERAHYHVVFVGDGGGGGYCMKTFTTTEGHKLFARCESHATPKGGAGTVILLGGTGPFTGIKGRGKFNVVFITERVSWDDMEWEWETP